MDWWGIVWLFVLLLINGFFVAAEFAVISARRSQIEPRAEAGSRSARTALWAMEHATLMLATCQLGITVCSLIILLVSEPAIHHLLEGPFHALGWPGPVVDGVSFGVTLVLVTFLHVVIGEMVPKNLSFTVPDRAVLILATPLVAIATVLRPIVAALNGIANGAIRVFGVTPRNETTSVYTLDQVATIVEQSTREGVLEDRTGALEAAFEFTTKRVEDVAVPLGGLVTLPEDATPADVESAVAKRGYSRYILVDEDGVPSGYVHLKDVLDLEGEEVDEPIPPKRVRRLATIWDETELEDALATMRREGAHIARAFDASGQTTGVLFLEDILEELVGTIDDVTERD
ncbi:MAG: HlyC/CorC family transporter [Microbacteriaceae bacterium]|nr:HlyC/CorC family transporter [Microbacteriaceae bacterium]